MEQLNRRTILGATGATFVLASCGESKDEKKGLNPCITGGDDNHGEFAERKGGKKFPAGNANKVTFDPAHACLIYIKLYGATITAEHGYFRIADLGASNPERRIATRKMLADHATTRWGGKIPVREQTNFEKMWFGSQQEIYLYIDNGTSVEFNPKYLLTFTSYGAADGRPKWDNGTDAVSNVPVKKMAENNAFYDMELIDPQFLTVNNWFTDKNGKKFVAPVPPVPEPQRPKGNYEEYSFNIHLRVKAGSKWIPIAIDPDTGNNGGTEP